MTQLASLTFTCQNEMEAWPPSPISCPALWEGTSTPKDNFKELLYISIQSILHMQGTQQL